MACNVVTEETWSVKENKLIMMQDKTWIKVLWRVTQDHAKCNHLAKGTKLQS